MDNKTGTFTSGSTNAAAPEFSQQDRYCQEGNGLAASHHPLTLPDNPQQPQSFQGLPSYCNNQSRLLAYQDRSTVTGIPWPQNDRTSNFSYRNQTIPPPTGAPTGAQNGSSFRNVNYGRKSLVEAYLLAVVFGLVGAHHIYLRRYAWGVLYFFTFGLLGCGYVIDLFRVPYLVRKFNREHRLINNDIDNDQRLKAKKDLSDAYVVWFPFGLIGFHHYYLGNYRLGVLFTFTFGVIGLGWLIDACRMPSLVKEANNARRADKIITTQKKDLWLCYILALPPLGFLGLHHFYMRRPFFGYAYVLTFGQFGIGWLIDLFRMPVLLRRCNDELNLTRKRDVKTIDDCYIVWFVSGLLGFHHYYLGRLGWGLLYTFTLGICGIGWLIDFVRIPQLVREANRIRDAMEEQLIADTGNLPESASPYQYRPTQPRLNDNNYGSLSFACVVTNFDTNSNDVMRLPGNYLPYTTVPAPPAYSVHDNVNSNNNYEGRSNLEQNPPPPYKQ